MNRKISTNLQTYLHQAESTKTPSILFNEIVTNNDSLTDSLSLIYTIAQKHQSIDQKIIDYLITFEYNEMDYEVKELIVKIIFVIIERLKSKQSKVKSNANVEDDEVTTNNTKSNSLLDHICYILNCVSFDLTNFLLNALNYENCIETVKEIIEKTKCYNFVIEVMKEIKRNENSTPCKNAIKIIVYFSKYFSIEEFEVLNENEHFYFRICYLEIIYEKMHNKSVEKSINRSRKEKKKHINDDDSSNASNGSISSEDVSSEDIKNNSNSAIDKPLSVSVYVILERLSDLNHFVRSKAIQLLGNLFTENMLKKQINEILLILTSKIHDKTVIVRKKSICFFSNYLMVNNNEILDCNLNSIFSAALNNSMILLKSRVTSEVVEIIHFIKLAYFYKVKDSKSAFENLFNLIWDKKTKKVILESIKEIIERTDPVTFFYTFCSNNESYKKVMKSIKFRKNWIERIQNNFFSNNLLFESSIILSNVKNQCVSSRFVSFATHILFKSANEEELKINCEIYKNVLKMIVNNHKNNEVNKDMNEYEDITTIVAKNLVKMNFIDFQIIDLTIKILFKNKKYETNILKMIEMMKVKEDNVKIVYCIGSICSELHFFLENVERQVKNKANNNEKTNFDNKTLVNKSSNVDNSFINNSMIDNTFINNSLIDCTFVNKLQEKNDLEEVNDFLTYLKEKEIIYNSNSLIKEILPIVKEMIQFSKEDINEGANHCVDDLQNIAYITMYKIMLCSSEFFIENIKYLKNGLKSTNMKVKNTSIFALADFIVNYSAWVEKFTDTFFDILEMDDSCSTNGDNTSIYDGNASIINGDSPCDVIQKNCILIVFKMILKNLIKLKGHGKVLVMLINNNNIGNIIQKLISSLTENEIFNILYETVCEVSFDEIKDKIEFICRLISKDKLKENLYNKMVEVNGSEKMNEISKVLKHDKREIKIDSV
ncbi:condensin complex non-SMC subunit Cnd1 [Binucleata daphniae]